MSVDSTFYLGDVMTRDTRTISLGEIFDAEELDQIQYFLNRRDLPSLRQWLVSREEELAKKEIDPNYLYYAICYAAGVLL